MGDIDRPTLEARAASAAGFELFAAVSSVFDTAQIVLYVADMETHELLFFNSHAERLWGGDWAGKRCYEVLQAGQSGPCAFCTNQQLMRDGQPGAPVVWEFQNTVNKRWYLCIDKAIPWSDGRQVRMEVAIDITDRKAHEEFRDQYLGLISHDLRSPLATIAISAAVLKRSLERQGLSDDTKPADVILRNAQRMGEMIEDLLETTRLESASLRLRKSAFDLGEVARSVAEQLGVDGTRSIGFEADGPAPVIADAGRIERVLENLVGNALQHSDLGMPVRIRVETNAKETIVTVADRGAGIPASELPKLFQRFSRATSARSANGLGLGLYNCRLIVESHGGRIWAESEIGSGSTFGFALPVGP